MDFQLSKHAEEELTLRKIPRDLLRSVLQNPQQIVPERAGRKVYQSQLDFGNGKIFLLRAVVDDNVDLPVVVTVYRTTKITKYWQSE